MWSVMRELSASSATGSAAPPLASLPVLLRRRDEAAAVLPETLVAGFFPLADMLVAVYGSLVCNT
jgi:hypothetical protein